MNGTQEMIERHRPQMPATFRDRLCSRVDPLQSYAFTPLGWIITAVLIVLVLLPAAVYPLGPDEGLFFVTAQKMLRGAIHYRDIVDIKPPLIYYLYAAGIWLLGPTAVSIHIVDVVLQGITCFLIIGLVRRVGGNDIWGAAAAVTYAVLYVILNYGNVAQSESYAGLLGIPMIRLLMFRRTRSGYFLIGLLGGTLFLLKFSLVAILGSLAVAELLLFDDDWRKATGNWLAAAAGFGVMFGLFVLYLVAFDAYRDFLLMQQFTSGYVRVQSPSPGEWFKHVSQQIPAYLSDNYSILLFLATATGISLAVSVRSSKVGGVTMTPESVRLMRVCTILFLVLLATVAVESKFLPYHFSRFYAFSSILAAFGGMTALHSFLQQKWHDRFMWFGAAIIAPLLLLFSPIPRYVWHSSGVVLNVVKGAAAYDEHYDYSIAGDTVLNFTAIQGVGRYLRSHRLPGDEVLLASSAGGLVAYEAGYIPDFKIYHFAFVAAPFGPHEWKDQTHDYIFNQRPRFVVAQLYNHEPTLSGTRTTSEEALLQLPGVDSLIRHAYHLAHSENVFHIYERNRP